MPTKASIIKQGKTKTFVVHIGGTNMCKNIYSYLYKNASVYLTRKKDIFEKIINKKIN